jgi:hypothetical protein
MNKACIIIPYFGSWGSYFNIFLKSCSYNEEVIDYLFLTDIPKPDTSPKNVYFESFSLNDFNELASEKLSQKINITKPYKLCDFKPMFGMIFTDFLIGYEFWGHGDEDLILGDLNNFLTPIMDGHDVISVRKEWNSGSFCLFRNTLFINSLFLECQNLVEVYNSAECLAFDETFKDWHNYRQLNFDIFSQEKASMTVLVMNAQKNNQLRAHYKSLIKESINDDDYVKFDNGKITQKGGREFMIYHFITEKKKFEFTYPDWKLIPDIFYIDNTGFFN